MGARVAIIWPAGRLEAELFDTPSADAVLDALPAEVSADILGEELRLRLGANVRLEDAATQIAEPGAVCYWVDGAALVLPFGLAPVARGYECCLLTAMNVLGRIDGDHRMLRSVREGDILRVERVN